MCPAGRNWRWPFPWAPPTLFSAARERPTTELRLALAHADRVVILMDSFGELERAGALAAEMDTTIRCGVRLTVNPTGLWRKFGIPLQDLPVIFGHRPPASPVTLTGLQFHTSWNLSPAPQVAFIGELGKGLAAMPAADRARLNLSISAAGTGRNRASGFRRQEREGKQREALGQPAGDTTPIIICRRPPSKLLPKR
jgi:hypothetical protein